jgi:hypothetical protein
LVTDHWSLAKNYRAGSSNPARLFYIFIARSRYLVERSANSICQSTDTSKPKMARSRGLTVWEGKSSAEPAFSFRTRPRVPPDCAQFHFPAFPPKAASAPLPALY